MWPSFPQLEPHHGHPLIDPVELWKSLARAQVEREAKGPATLRIRVSVGVVLASFVLGLPSGVVRSVAISAVVLSVLVVQELPRALLARALGQSVTMAISLRGGDTEVAGPGLSGAAWVALLVIGSLANFAVGIALFAGASRLPPGAPSSFLLASALAHLAWAAAQSLPLVPFRMGRLLASRLRARPRFAQAARSLVIATGALVLLGARMMATAAFPLVALVVVAAAAEVAEAFNESCDAQAGREVAIQKAESCVADGRPKEAADLALQLLEATRSPRLRARLWKTAAWAAIGRGDPLAAHAALGRMSRAAIDLHLVASYLACCNRTDEALRLLEQARDLGLRTRETTMLLIDLHFRRGELHAARSVARSSNEVLSSEDKQRIEVALSA